MLFKVGVRKISSLRALMSRVKKWNIPIFAIFTLISARGDVIPLGIRTFTSAKNARHIQNNDLSRVEGMVNCKVLPPPNLLLRVLPSKVHQRLILGLCARAARNCGKTTVITSKSVRVNLQVHGLSTNYRRRSSLAIMWQKYMLFGSIRPYSSIWVPGRAVCLPLMLIPFSASSSRQAVGLPDVQTERVKMRTSTSTSATRE